MIAARFFSPWFLVCAFVGVAAPPASAQVYVIDPEHTSVVFSCGHGSLSYTYGMFSKAQGDYVLDKTNPANCRFRFSIDANSLTTNNQERDTHLKSPDFFNTREFPTITFVSTRCAQANHPQGGVAYNVTGNLTMHGVTREITVPVQMLGEGVGVSGKDQRTGFFAHTELKRSDFGMGNLLNIVGDAVGATISFEGVLQNPQGGAAPAGGR